RGDCEEEQVDHDRGRATRLELDAREQSGSRARALPRVGVGRRLRPHSSTAGSRSWSIPTAKRGAKMSEEAQRLSPETGMRRDRREQSESVRPLGRSVGVVCDIQSGRGVCEILGVDDPTQPRLRYKLSPQGQLTYDFQGRPESILRVVSI